MSHHSRFLVRLRVENSTGTFAINHAEIESGYFHPSGSFDKEVQVGTINRMEFSEDRMATICATNRTTLGFESHYGTEGRFDIYRARKKVVHVYWKIPSATGDNGMRDRHWSTDPPTITVATRDILPWSDFAPPGEYDVEAIGLRPESFENPDGFGTVWSSDYQGLIKITVRATSK
jgi:hypothetical protein